MLSGSKVPKMQFNTFLLHFLKATDETTEKSEALGHMLKYLLYLCLPHTVYIVWIILP